MFLKYLGTIRMFTTVKHELFHGKYYIQAPPKRPLSAYFLFTNDARKKIPQTNEKVNIGEQAKVLAGQWKQIKPEQKQKYEKKASQLKAQYQVQKAKYQAKFVDPFKRVTFMNLITKDFYQKNKFTSLAEGTKAVNQYKNTLKEQELDKYKKLAEQKNKAHEDIIKKYEIPTPQFKDFKGYLRHVRKSDPNLPPKLKIDPSKLAKLQKEYQAAQNKYKAQLQSFAKSFSIKVEDLVKLINKEKDPSQKLDQQGRSLKQLQEHQKKVAAQNYKKATQEAAKEKEKLLKKIQREKKKQLKKINAQVEKSKKGLVRASNKYASKINRVVRQKQELKIQSEAEKKLRKTKQQTRKGKKSDSQHTEPSTKTQSAPTSVNAQANK